MQDRSSNRPRDPNELAKLMVDITTGDASPEVVAAHDSSKNQAAVYLGRMGGLKGGNARAAKLSPEKRSEIAKAAAGARWKKNGEEL